MRGNVCEFRKYRHIREHLFREHFLSPHILHTCTSSPAVCGDGSSSSKEVPAAAVLAAQKEVAKEIEKIANPRQKRGAYATISEELGQLLVHYSCSWGHSPDVVKTRGAKVPRSTSRALSS